MVATLGEGFSDTHVSTLTALRSPFVYIFTDGDQAGRLMGNKIAYAFRGSLLVKVMECPWGPVIESDSGYQRMKVDPSILPYDYIRQLYRRAPVVRKKIKWTNPPPIFDPRSSS